MIEPHIVREAEIDGYTVRYDIMGASLLGPHFVKSWTIVTDSGSMYTSAPHGLISLAQAEALCRKVIEAIKPKEPKAEPEPQNLEEAVASLLVEVDAAVEEENWYLGNMEEAAEHVRRFLLGKS
ncbi:hypothetical protein LCGC14_0332110 [marine sediment metagenome]|uniref:Uncharacterized protein n=1 Tax=marine sediment metagenome TaxID=412755 RepID=A0A0F9TZ13_9ZZZZ